jgi:hypothetical protein
MSLKNTVTPPGIDPGTVRLVAQRLNQYATPGPRCYLWVPLIARDFILLLFLFLLSVFYTLLSFLSRKASFLPSCMFRPPTAVIIRELQYYKGKNKLGMPVNRTQGQHYTIVSWCMVLLKLFGLKYNGSGNKMSTGCNGWIFIADLIACSTCFRHHYAHHQELERIIQVVAAHQIYNWNIKV